MKIVLCMDNPVIPTGYASTCRLTAYELIKRGHEVYAMAFNGGGSHEGIADWNGIKVIPNYALSRDKNAIYGDPELITKVYNDIKPDIIFFHNDSYRYAYLKDMPEEIMRRSVFWLPFEGTVPDQVGLQLFNKMAATRFVTHNALDMHKEQLEGHDIGVIYHAIDLDHLGPTGDKQALKAGKNLGLENKFVVCRVDRHQPRKYWDRTIKAFARFAEGKDDVFLLCKCNPRDITMYNEEKKEGLNLDELAEQLAIKDKVFFDDFFFDDSFMADAFFRPADVFLTTTSGEGFGLTPAEAMACGTPVLYPDTPVLPEVIGEGGIKFEGEGRIYYEPMHVWHNLASIDGAAAKLQWAYEDWKKGGEELKKVSARGIELARKRYSPQVIYDQWDQVFQSVVDRDELVSVITVIYNLKGEEQIYGDDGINKFKETMEKYVTTPYEWIIVDNGSPAREVTRAWMKSAAEANPRIKPQYSNLNLGFAGANNLGISKASGKWIVLSNPDSEVLDHNTHGSSGDYLKVMVDTAKNDQEIGIVGMEINSRSDILPDVEFPYFCNVLITKDCLDAIKLDEGKWFDEGFWPAYYEDSLGGERCVPVKIDGKIDVVPLAELFASGEIRTRPDGKEESMLHMAETLAVCPEHPCPDLDIESLPEWWQNRFLSVKEKEAYRRYQKIKNWRKAQRDTGLANGRSANYLSTRIRNRIRRSRTEEIYATWTPIQKVVRHISHKSLVTVNSKNGQTRCTEDHSLMAWDGQRLKKCKPCEISDNKLCSVSCEVDCQPDESLSISFQGGKREGNFVRFKNTRGEDYFFPAFLSYDSKEAHSLFSILGEFVSEGYVSASQVRISGTDKDAVDKNANSLKILTKRDIRVHESDIPETGGTVRGKTIKANVKKSYSTLMTNRHIANFFAKACGKGAKNKKIPSFVYTAPIELKKEFLSHLLRGDAHNFDSNSNHCLKYSDSYRNEAFKFSTTSLRLASGICLLLGTMNKRFSFCYDNEKKSYQISYVKYRKNTRERVKRIDVLHVNREYAYDLVVPEYHTFVDAAGMLVVHNTDITMRARAKTFKVVSNPFVPFYHKSGGTNKYAIEGGPKGPFVKSMKDSLERARAAFPDMTDWDRKKAELDSGGMQAMIAGNISYLNSRYGLSARSKIKIVWQTHIGDGVGFSQIVEGLAPEMENLGFDVYINDWSNGGNIEDPRVRKMVDKYQRANVAGELDDAVHIVCWLMETYLNVDANYKIGVSLCESTKVRESYLQACNGMDRILTFSKFCKSTQINSGFKVPIDVIAPGVHPIYLNYYERPLYKPGWGHAEASELKGEPKKFSFLNVGVSQGRKDTLRLVQAFCEAFPKGAELVPDVEAGFPLKPGQVELILKSNNFGELNWVEKFKHIANIRTIFTGKDHRAERANFSMQEMYDLYCDCDAYVHPSHGEGIGLPIIEAAATGLPVIFTNWSSPAEYLSEDNSYPISLSPYAGTTYTKAYPGAPGDNGVWANCHIGHLKHLMLQVIRERAEARNKGSAAAEHMKANFAWEKTAKDMIPLVFEWDRERSKKDNKAEFDPMTYSKPKMEPIRHGDRMMIDVCFAPGSPVRTPDGSKPIEEIKKGDLVLTHQGRFKKVSKTFARQYDGKVSIIRGLFNNHRIVATSNHPFLAVKTNKCSQKGMEHVVCKPNCGSQNKGSKSRCKKEKRKYRDYQAEFIRADELLRGDALVLPLIKEETTRKTRIDLLEYVKAAQLVYDDKYVWCKTSIPMSIRKNPDRITLRDVADKADVGWSIARRGIFGSPSGVISETSRKAVLEAAEEVGYKTCELTYVKVKRFVELDGDLARIFGFYLAEGSSAKSNLTFSFNRNEKEYHQDVLQVVLRKFGVQGHLYHKKDNSTHVTFCSKPLASFFKEFLGTKRSKKIPDLLATLPTLLTNEVIFGLWHGDGSDDDFSFSYASVCPKLAYGMSNLFLKAGVISSVIYRPKRDIYTVIVSGRDNIKMASGILRYKHAWNASKTSIRWWSDDDNFYLPIADVETSRYSGMVYNLEVEEDNTYCVAHAVVHNCTRDRHSHICALLVSLLNQTLPYWDIIIQCDDSDEAMVNDQHIMSLMARLTHEGHGWRIIRSFRQGPHMAHDRTLQMASEDKNYNYKLICRVDDDITLKANFLENLYKVFLEDEACDVAAVGGVYLDPKRSDAEQIAPAGFASDINYAGKIDHNVMWPYVCRYPDGTGLRSVEHLYSSFLYRTEVACSVGGYCKRFSQIGHREESDFSYRFHMAGFKQFIQPESIGYHFFAQSGGIRSMDIREKQSLAEMDNQIYEQRLAKWKKRAEMRKQGKANVVEITPSVTVADQAAGLPEPPEEPKQDVPQQEDSADKCPKLLRRETKNKVALVIDGSTCADRTESAVSRFHSCADEIYVTCPTDEARDALSKVLKERHEPAFMEKLCMIASSADESAMITQGLASQGDHNFILTISDTMVFDFDPTSLISDEYDDYVFEIYKSYVPGRAAKDVGGNVVFVQDDSLGKVIGPEAENRCLLYRRKLPGKERDLSRVYYADTFVIDDVLRIPVNGKSVMGNDLVTLSDIDRKPWRKLCVYQYPEGRLKTPRYIDVSPSKAPLVSIVIPTPGRLQHLRRCMSSIYSNTTTPYEVIVVDNGSTDGTAEYLDNEAKKDNVRVIHQKVNLGYQRAVNLAVSQSKGQYVLLFNDDAWVEKRMPDGRDWVRTMVDALEKDPSVALVGPHGDKSPSLGIDMLFFWCAMLRSSTWDQVGPLDDKLFFNYGGDDDYCMRLLNRGYKVKAMPEFEGILRHLMNLEPEQAKDAELQASRVKLKSKYRKVVTT